MQKNSISNVYFKGTIFPIVYEDMPVPFKVISLVINHLILFSNQVQLHSEVYINTCIHIHAKFQQCESLNSAVICYKSSNLNQYWCDLYCGEKFRAVHVYRGLQTFFVQTNNTICQASLDMESCHSMPNFTTAGAIQVSLDLLIYSLIISLCGY